MSSFGVLQTVGDKRRQARAKGTNGRSKGNAQRLDMYQDWPMDEQTIEYLEQCAIDRLRLLRAIDDGISAGKRDEELQAVIRKEEEECQLRRADGLTFNASGTTRDATSHFLLRLASCRSADQRKWFVQNELELFKYRFKQLDTNAKIEFMKDNDFKTYSTVSSKECAAHAAELRDILESDFEFKKSMSEKFHGSSEKLIYGAEWSRICTEAAKDAKGWYKVDFEEVTSLVKARRTFMLDGVAWVRRESMDALVLNHFRTVMSEGVANAIQMFKKFEDAEANRLTPLLKSLHKRYEGKAYAFDGSESDVLTIPAMEATTESFPLCMRQLYKAFKTKHHLTHAGRRALQLYLKGIGMQLGDAMVLWKTEFTKSPDCSAEKFEKDYAYGIRHSYGKEGKRVNYTPHSCGQCIASDPGVKDDHGCPFKTLTANKDNAEGVERLNDMLRGMNISQVKASAIVTKAKNMHYQIACGMTFAALHDDKEIDAGVHTPHQYYLESRRIRNPRKIEADSGTQGAPTPVAAST
mmetsp:Transcript_6223/g.22457  ORF Transcript_6223/g.22457 Transcript_6223/m.22457 type:complete len:523 (+) Transcript_6223:4898-6466(+)